jgi:hypothetical protein
MQIRDMCSVYILKRNDHRESDLIGQCPNQKQHSLKFVYNSRYNIINTELS